MVGGDEWFVEVSVGGGNRKLINRIGLHWLKIIRSGLSLKFEGVYIYRLKVLLMVTSISKPYTL